MARHHKSHKKSHSEKSEHGLHKSYSSGHSDFPGRYPAMGRRRAGENEFGYGAGIGHDAHEGIMSSDRSKIANCPQDVMYHDYPRETKYLPEEIDDSLRAADAQIDGDNSQRMRGTMPRKA